MQQEMILGDCQNLLSPAQIPLGGAVMIADPPYSPRVHTAMASCAAHGARKGVRQRDAGFAALTPELRSHIAALGARCRWAVIFTDWEGLSAWIEAFGAHSAMTRWVRPVPWIRWSMPQLSGDRPPSGSECVALFGARGRMRWNGPGNLTHFDAKCERGAGKHPTAKPLDLMLQLVSYFSDPGELVLDPCAGRGTTLLAARELGRSALGFELQAEEVVLAQKRLGAPLGARDSERKRRWEGAPARDDSAEMMADEVPESGEYSATGE